MYKSRNSPSTGKFYDATVTIVVYFIRKFADGWGWGKFLCHIRNNATKLSVDNETHTTIIHAILLYYQDIHDRHQQDMLTVYGKR